MNDRPETARTVAAALDAALDRLTGRGVSDLEAARGALAAALARLARVLPPDEIAAHLVGIAGGIADTAQPDRGKPN